MEKKLQKLEKKAGKIFAIFEKMIAKLLGHNESLQDIINKSREEIEKHQTVINTAAQAMNINQTKINQIETFIGVGKESTTNEPTQSQSQQ